MENNIRFRNHISIVAERIGRFFVVIVAMLVGVLIQNRESLVEGADFVKKNWRQGFIPALILLIILVACVVWQVVIWSKTYISIQDNTIVMERNTLNRKKNTIGIKNISNVNTEQNLFEMLMGTCKVKLDTNSLTTADKTDVKIVLKKADAESFRWTIMQYLHRDDGQTIGKTDHAESEAGEQYDIHATAGDMLAHGLFSVNLFSVFVIIGCIVGAVQVFSRTIGMGVTGKSILEILTSLLVVFMFFCSAIWDIVKGFVRYYDFRVKRRGDKIHIKYGLLKKVNYTIPVDKINAVKVSQSLIARIAGRYMAEIINVGMGDDESEKMAFFILYCKKERIKERIRILLPEFEYLLEQPVSKQPKAVWAVWLPSSIMYIAVIAILLVFGISVAPQYALWIWLGAAALIVLFVIMKTGNYCTAGSAVRQEHLLLVNGYFGRSVVCIKYSKIQYIKIEQNFIAKRLGIQKGNIYLLASALNRVHAIPYFTEKDTEELKIRMEI